MSAMTVEAVREAINNKQDVVGFVFVNSRGAQGTVLAGLSDHGKRQAEMTCTEPNCTETHVREQSDWGQSYRCRSHSKTKAKASGAGQAVGGGIVGEDGVRYNFMRILPTDDAETVTQKSENNAIFESLKAARVAAERAAKDAKAAERKAAQAQAREEKKAKLAAEKKEQRAAQIAKMRKYAEENNIPISDVTLKQLSPES